MRLLADQCIARSMTGALRKAGHDVLAVRNLCDGCPDDEIVALACRHDCIILTEDTDFGELVVRRRESFCCGFPV